MRNTGEPCVIIAYIASLRYVTVAGLGCGRVWWETSAFDLQSKLTKSQWPIWVGSGSVSVSRPMILTKRRKWQFSSFRRMSSMQDLGLYAYWLCIAQAYHSRCEQCSHPQGGWSRYTWLFLHIEQANGLQNAIIVADVCGAAGDVFIAISLSVLFHRARSGIVKFVFSSHLSPSVTDVY